MRKSRVDKMQPKDSFYYDEMKLAKKIKDVYPKIKQIKFKFEEDKPLDEVKNPDSLAFFMFKCPYYECIDGGYDLSSIIQDMVRKSDKSRNGMEICGGWQDEERINKYHCLRNMKYHIDIKYKNDK